jgi:AcrR family transcriptional regulator/acyl-CoA thioesterase FadM
VTAARTSQARPADRREQLLAAAQQVIRRDGFARATVAEITREANASLGLLHYHFGAKDDLVARAFAAHADAELRELEAVAHGPGPAPVRLAAYLAASAWDDASSWRMWVDAWGEALRVPALCGTLERFGEGWSGALADILRDGAEAGDWACPDPGDLAARLVAVIDGVGLKATVHPDAVPPDRAAAWARRIAELELDVELPGVAAPPAAVAPGAQPHAVRLPIRARDLDAEGRLHTAAVVALLEDARTAWLAGRLGRPPSGARFELAGLAMDLRRPPAADEAEVVVHCALERADDASLRTRERVETAAGAPVAAARATLVALDDAGVPRPLRDDELEAVGA